MKLLFVASRFPYPPFNGDQVRAYHHLRVLSRRHAIVLLAPEPVGQPDECLEAITPFCAHVEVVPVSRWRSLARLARAPFQGLPLQTLVFYEPEIGRRAHALARDWAVDLVHVQMIRMAPVIASLGSLPRVIDLIDSMSVNLSRQAERSRPPKAWLASWEARRVGGYERALPTAFDQLVISSPLDRSAIGDFSNLHVVANGVDLAAHPFVTAERTEDALVFSGTMWYFPNVDAAQWLVHEVLPLIRRHRPHTTLTIVGARPVAAVRRLAEIPGVTVTGQVPSVHDYVARSTVAVAPMRSGSGIQFKIIEAMAAGTPVVATPTATAGLQSVAGRDLLVGADAESFAAQVVRLLEDRPLRQRLAQNALRLVQNVYAWERTVESLEQAYERALSAHELVMTPPRASVALET
jgi:sugar transferase (PEP-CTERM/EpsH1 system associated)